MRIIEVLIERKAQSLNRPFSYVYFGNKDVNIGYRVLVPFGIQKLVGFVISVETRDRKSVCRERV